MGPTPQFVVRLNDEDRATLRKIMRRQRLDSEADAMRWLIRSDPAAGAPMPEPPAQPKRPTQTEDNDDEAEGFE